MKQKFHILLLAGMTLLLSCKRSSDKPLWNVDLLAPLVQSSLTIANLIKDTTNIKANPDNSIMLINRQELAAVALDSLVTLSTDPYAETVTLSSLVLPTRYDTTRITIENIADVLIATGDPDNVTIGNLIKFAAAIQAPVDLSGLPALTFENIDVDVSSFFQTADIATGTLTIEVINRLPADIQSLGFNFKNKASGTAVASHTFTNLAALGGSGTYTEDLAGKQVEGVLSADINSMQLMGPSNATVRLDQAIEVVMTISGVTVNSAIAVFPSQDVMQKQEEASLTAAAMGDVLLTKAVIESGAMKMEVSSTVQDVVYFTYKIPKAIKNGVPFEMTTSMPAASPGNPSHKEVRFDLEGYEMDFTGLAGDKYNTFYYTLSGRIESSGIPVALSLSDFVMVTVTAEELKPTSVEGYLGQRQFTIGPDVLDLALFKGIESGTLNFEHIDMNLTVDNGFGIDAAITINDMSTYSTRTGQSAVLSPLPLVIPVGRATAPGLSTLNPGTVSNATALLNVLPDKVSYSAQVTTNPAGNNGLYNDFAQKSALMKAFLEIEMPLSIRASQLVLSDTAVFNTAAIKKKNVHSGTFKIFVNNGFPLSAALKMYFLNPYGEITDSMKSLPNAIMAAPVNAAHRVIEKRSSEVIFEADETKMYNLYNSDRVIFKIEFTTEPTSSFMKIYSDYSIDFKMVGDMDYAIHKK